MTKKFKPQEGDFVWYVTIDENDGLSVWRGALFNLKGVRALLRHGLIVETKSEALKKLREIKNILKK